MNVNVNLEHRAFFDSRLFALTLKRPWVLVVLYSSENEVSFFQESAQRSIRRCLCEKFGVHLFFNLTAVSFLISIDSRELTLNFASLDLFTILRYYKDKNLLIDITIKICKHILCWNNVWFN